MRLCSTTFILSRRTRIAEEEKRQKDSPPASLRFASPPSGGKLSLSLGTFRGGLGAAPPVMELATRWPHRVETVRLGKKPRRGIFPPLRPRVSGFLRPDDPRQRPGVFRASGNVLRARINSFERNYLRLVLFDGLFSCLDAVSNAAGEAEGRADHVRVGSA